MQILAGSLEVEVSGLLHAGYLSAYPRTFVDHGYGRDLAVEATPKVVDVTAALALKESGKAAPQANLVIHESMVHPGLLRPGLQVSQAASLAIVFVFFAYLFGLYVRRMLRMRWLGWLPWACVLLASLFMVLTANLMDLAGVMSLKPVSSSWQDAAYLNSAPCPWQDVAVREYQNPETATQVILHGLIVNGLAGCSFQVEKLCAIQNEVAFPVPAESYTPGMSYAQQTYGRDGWGREFKLETLKREREFPPHVYCVASAGADGVFGTPDDIRAMIASVKESTWERRIDSVFMRPGKTQPMCLMHCIGDCHYRAIDAAAGQRLTGTKLFDAFQLERLYRRGKQDKRTITVAELKGPDNAFVLPPGEDRLFLVRFEKKSST